MAENKQDGIAVFDTLFTNNHICMLKILLPFLPPSYQKSIAIYIKYLEFQYTFQYFSRHPSGLSLGQNSCGQNAFTPDAIWENLLPFCNQKEKQNFTQMRNMMQTFRNMKDMMEMMETMKEFMPEGFGNGGFENFTKAFGLGNEGPDGGMDFSQMAEMFSAFTAMNTPPSNQ